MLELSSKVVDQAELQSKALSQKKRRQREEEEERHLNVFLVWKKIEVAGCLCSSRSQSMVRRIATKSGRGKAHKDKCEQRRDMNESSDLIQPSPRKPGNQET